MVAAQSFPEPMRILLIKNVCVLDYGKKNLFNRHNNVAFLLKVLASLILNHMELTQVSRNCHIINDEEILHS